MKKFTITLALSILAVLLVAAPCNAKGKAKHVVLIGLDGWGAYSVPKADIPTIKQLMADGAYTLEKRSALPSSSAINWASMFMGAGPELHGYTQWGSKTPELPSRVLNQHGIFPTIFQLLRDDQHEDRLDARRARRSAPQDHAAGDRRDGPQERGRPALPRPPRGAQERACR